VSERTEISFDAALMMALRADAQKELDELPTPAQLKERYPDTSRWDARLKAALHKRCPVLKRVLVVAMTLVILTLGALAVSADFRKAVYTMIQKFLPIEMQLTYQVDGEPLERLPDGYSDHYVPDGFEMDDAHAIPLDVLASISSLFSISTDELLGLDAPEVLSLSGLTEVQKKTLIKLRNELLSPSQKGNDLSPQQMEILHDVIKDFG
jgi:hypothetical protein